MKTHEIRKKKKILKERREETRADATKWWMGEGCPVCVCLGWMRGAWENEKGQERDTKIDNRLNYIRLIYIYLDH